jgi:hypothetical protein
VLPLNEYFVVVVVVVVYFVIDSVWKLMDTPSYVTDISQCVYVTLVVVFSHLWV